MNQLLSQLGINLPLFISQVVNFFILLIVLTVFVYKPLLKVIKARQGKIKDGLEKAEEAGVRLKEIDNIGKEKIKEADQKSISIIKATEERAKVLDHQMQEKMEKKEREMHLQMQENFKKQKEETKNLIMKDAMDIIKKTIVKTVEMDPKAIDENLIKKAILQIENEK